MFILNITFVVDTTISETFEIWLKEKVVLLAEKSISSSTYIIHAQVEENMLNYSLQISFPSFDEFEVFRNIDFIKIITQSQRVFGEKVLFFDTLLESF